ncbi:MAG: dihydroorotase [Aminobacterium sp.]|uniref:dihydroorotase n=1 Tax=Aminobacterium sp. TaxID=1872491 RepID=UPI001BCF64F8|nr:dihydroorotase [Aminobacterium sp.]MEA4877389.1 dihydroorotase [Aminobacterium sp.]
MILFKNARIFDGKELREEVSDVLVAGKKIEKIAETIDVTDDMKVIDLEGKVLAPGFIDLHVHFRDPGFEWREDIESGSKAAAAGGYTTVVTMPNTDPVIDIPSLVEYIAEKGRRAGGARVLPGACISHKRKGEYLAELGLLREAGAVLFTDDGAPVKTSKLLRTALLYSQDVGAIIMEHPEEASLTEKGQVNEGRISALSGLKGFPHSAEYIDIERGIALCRETGAPIHFTHVSTALAFKAIAAAKKEGLPVTCDVTPHHLSLDENNVIVSRYHAVYKVNPPLRSREDVKAAWAAIADGTIDAIVTDHAPWHENEKDLPFQEAPFGIASLECSVAVVLDTWLKMGQPVSLARVLELFTSGPAAILPEEWQKLGHIAEGLIADLTVIDLDESKVVDVSTWKSKARMTPWNGEVLTGWPVMTILEGKIFDRGEDNGSNRS